jgi:predicted enzyme related to lactoylglutathione lyase
MSKRNIVHIEIPSKDDKDSAKFYSDLFGWKIIPLPEMNYIMWEPTELPGGGFNPLSPENKVGDVLIYIDSDDITTDLKKIVEHGGEIVHPRTEIPGSGWYGIFKDPTGNKVGLFTSNNSDSNK